MKQYIKLVPLVFAVLLLSTVYTYAAPDKTPSNMYKLSYTIPISDLKQIVSEAKLSWNTENEEKQIEAEKEMQLEMERMMETEREAAIKNVRQYYEELLAAIKTIDSRAGQEKISEYEREKEIEIEEEMNQEVWDYLQNVLEDK